MKNVLVKSDLVKVDFMNFEEAYEIPVNASRSYFSCLALISELTVKMKVFSLGC